MRTSVEGTKRQLPPWMIPKVGATVTHVSDSDNAVRTNSSIKKGEVITTNATKEDKKSEPSRRKSSIRAKCEVKERKKLDQQDESGNNVNQKKKKNSDKSNDRDQRSSIKKRKKLEDPALGCRDVYPVQACSDDAMDLTVEDLMVIAEQYVKDYENMDREEKSSRQHESKWQFQVTNETGTTVDSPCENKYSSGSAREDLSNSISTTSEVIATSTSLTGDPAQVMLELFLGPLVMKTLEKEEKRKSVVENVEITHEFTRQSQDEVAREEIVPLVKKRNTLKDKVAMFLDQDM